MLGLGLSNKRAFYQRACDKMPPRQNALFQNALCDRMPLVTIKMPLNEIVTLQHYARQYGIRYMINWNVRQSIKHVHNFLKDKTKQRDQTGIRKWDLTLMSGQSSRVSSERRPMLVGRLCPMRLIWT